MSVAPLSKDWCLPNIHRGKQEFRVCLEVIHSTRLDIQKRDLAVGNETGLHRRDWGFLTETENPRD